jgi:hypothetical protein
MSAASGSRRIDGRLHLSLTTVAHCYEVQTAWLEAVYEQGLLRHAQVVETSVLIEASDLDRVARIVRLHFHHGVDLAGIEVLLDRWD